MMLPAAARAPLPWRTRFALAALPVALALMTACAPTPSAAATPAATAPPAAAATSSGATAPESAAPAVAQTGSQPGAQADAQPSVEQGLQLVAATYNALQDRFFRPLDSRTLLQAAWDGARRSLSDHRRAISGVSAPTLTGDRQADLAQFSESFRALLAAAGPDADATRAAMAASSVMTESVSEQHTVFLPPEQFARFRSSLTSEQGRVGLGILINGQSTPATIGGVVPGSPADKAGVREGDGIERIDGRDVTRTELREISELLRGEVGQPVTLTLRRAATPAQVPGPSAGDEDGGEVVEVTVTRERFVEPPLTMRVLPEGVCHFRLSTFPVAFAVGPTGRTIGQDLDHYLEQCEQAGGRGWIMDLRGNGGGASFTQVLGRFLDLGPVLVERDRNGGRYEQATDGHLFRVQRPLVVLIDGGSASASEAFASAVKEHKRGVVMGQQTAGALNTGNIVPLPLGAGMMVAIREVFSGVEEAVIDEVGVAPDIKLDFGRDTAALPPQVIEQALEPPDGVGPQAALPRVEGIPLSEAELRRRIEPVQLRAEDAERPEDQQIRGDLPVDTQHYYSSDSPDLEAARDRAVRLGWQGGLVRWLGAGFPPPFAADVEIYRDADGAHRDFREIYEPGEPHNPPQWRDIDPPIRLGDDTRALIGTGQNEGRIWIAWRRGNVNYVVARNVTPGESPDFAPLMRLAQIIDGRAQQTPP